MLLRGLLERFHDPDNMALVASWMALGKLTKAVTPEGMMRHVEFMRGALRAVVRYCLMATSARRPVSEGLALLT